MLHVRLSADQATARHTRYSYVLSLRITPSCNVKDTQYFTCAASYFEIYPWNYDNDIHNFGVAMPWLLIRLFIYHTCDFELQVEVGDIYKYLIDNEIEEPGW